MFDLYGGAAISLIQPVRSDGDAALTVLRPGDFATAVGTITGWPGYAPTPLHLLNRLARTLQLAELLYKDESPRFGLGSFKALGGAYAAARVLQREIAAITDGPVDLADICRGRHAPHAAGITLVCATDGNHGRSLAWGAQRFGARCVVYIHAGVSEGREEAMRAFGAEIVRTRGGYDDAVRIAREVAIAEGWQLVPDTSCDGYTEIPRDVMAGYGVMSHEINAVLNRPPTHALLQGGVGGLAASVSAVMRQRWGALAPRVIVVEPEHAACLFASAVAGEMCAVDIAEETVMAGLSCGEPSELAWTILREEVSDYVTIPDSLIGPTMRLLANPSGHDPSIQAGETGVAGLAAAIAIASNQRLRTACGFDRESRVLLIGSEGVTDPEIYAEIMEG